MTDIQFSDIRSMLERISIRLDGIERRIEFVDNRVDILTTEARQGFDAVNALLHEHDRKFCMQAEMLERINGHASPEDAP